MANFESTTARFAEGTLARIKKARIGHESDADFVRDAVLEAIERREKGLKERKYANLHHFAAERKEQLEKQMNDLLTMLEEQGSSYALVASLDNIAVQWAAWAEIRKSL